MNRYPFTEYMKLAFTVGELPIGGAILGAGTGTLLGMGAGALTPSRDEHGETHRLRNALIGGAAGFAGGTALGAAAGGGLRSLTRSQLHPKLQAMSNEGGHGVIHAVDSPEYAAAAHNLDLDLASRILQRP